MVGQKFVELLSNHPWFEIVALGASDRSVGKRYEEAIRGMGSALPQKIGKMVISPCVPSLPCKVVFSGLDSSVAGEIEKNFAQSGYIVISNSSNHRMDENVPLVIPEINGDHLQLMLEQGFGGGAMITNPNCSVTGIGIALKPLQDMWGIESVYIVTLQALSGAGYPGLSSIDILDNVIPFIAGEEAKIETELLKVLGEYHDGKIVPNKMRISAQCTRVPVSDGHLACISVKLKKKAHEDEIIASWRNFNGDLDLPTAPRHPIIYLENERDPQPKLHRNLEKGMAVSVGRLRKCPLMDWKFIVLSHNTVRGAAGCAILNAELMVVKGFIPYETFAS
jgi:aspartate-semialdehyde dehydrogenase